MGQLDPENHDGGTEIKSAKAATCTEKGYTGDTYCKGCGVKLSDGKEIPVTGHDLKHVPASAATSRVNGNTEYWYCEDCGKYYADAEAKTEITQASTVIPATGRGQAHHPCRQRQLSQDRRRGRAAVRGHGASQPDRLRVAAAEGTVILHSFGQI